MTKCQTDQGKEKGKGKGSSINLPSKCRILGYQLCQVTINCLLSSWVWSKATQSAKSILKT